MKRYLTIILSAAVIPFTAGLLLSGCASQEERTARVEERQDRIDYRTSGRQDRRSIRAERQDERAAAFVESR
jgi:hypothetical protein